MGPFLAPSASPPHSNRQPLLACQQNLLMAVWNRIPMAAPKIVPKTNHTMNRNPSSDPSICKYCSALSFDSAYGLWGFKSEACNFHQTFSFCVPYILVLKRKHQSATRGNACICYLFSYRCSLLSHLILNLQKLPAAFVEMAAKCITTSASLKISFKSASRTSASINR